MTRLLPAIAGLVPALVVASAASGRPWIDPELRDAVERRGRAGAVLLDPGWTVSGATGRSHRPDPAAILARLRSRSAAWSAGLRGGSGPAAGIPRLHFGPLTGTATGTLDGAGLRALAGRDDVEAILLDAPVEPPTTLPVSAAPIDPETRTWGLEALRVPAVWADFGLTGAKVRIGVIDTGVDPDHPDLAGRILQFRDFATGSATPTDAGGHGTHVIGTLLGGAASGRAIGVAPGARAIVAKAFGGPPGSTVSHLLAGMEWIVDPDQDPGTFDAPRIVTMSWHSGHAASQQPFYRAIEAMDALGIVANFSAGNMGDSGITHPKEHPLAFVAAASDPAGAIPEFSSRGPARFGEETVAKPDWAAPGTAVLSAAAGGGYEARSGTSMAAPHVAGLMALLLELDPSLTPPELRGLLAGTARDLGPPGWDGASGAGLLDARALVERARRFGRLVGSVQDPDGKTVPGARLVFEGSPDPVVADEAGRFSVRREQGPVMLEIRAFGFRPGRFEVRVDGLGQTRLEAVLDPAPEADWTGQVRGIDGPAPPGSALTIEGSPHPPCPIPASGTFALRLPEGEHRIRARAPGHAIEERRVVVPGPPVEILLRPVPPVLYVDDDLGKTHETWIEEGLVAAGLSYARRDRSAGPLGALEIAPYELVIWAVGDDFKTTLVPEDQRILEEYLATGGRLLLSGQDLSFSLRKQRFLRTPLRVAHDQDGARDRIVNGAGLSLSIAGGAANQQSPDVIRPLAGAKEWLRYGNFGGAAVLVPGRVLFLAFGLEAVDGAGPRGALLAAAAAALGGQDDRAQAACARRVLRRVGAFTPAAP